MRGEYVLSLLLTSGLVLSGCLTEDDGVIPDGVDDASELIGKILELVPLEADHDHSNVTAHVGAFNIELIAYNGLNDQGGDWIYGEADVVGEFAYVATLSPQGGFVIVDISDPETPSIVGRYIAATTYAADIKVTDDGRWAILGSQGVSNQPEWLPPRTPPADPSSVGINGFQLIDIQDKAKPKFVSFLPVEQNGVHMLDLHTIDGEVYAFGAPGSGGHVAIARLEETPAAGLLVPAGKYTFPNWRGGIASIPQTGVSLPPRGPHDVTIYDDEALGKPLMLVAAGTEGVHVVDVSNPMMPKLLGTWTQHSGAYVHTVMPALVDGERLIVATPETFTASEQQPLWIINASKLDKMQTLSVWRLPGEQLVYSQDYLFSTHNTNVKDGHVYLSHFHAGLWILDISTIEKAAEPQVAGVYMPTETGNLAVGGMLGLDAVPLVWDAIPLDDGTILIADIPTGLYRVTDPTAPITETIEIPATPAA